MIDYDRKEFYCTGARTNNVPGKPFQLKASLLNKTDLDNSREVYLNEKAQTSTIELLNEEVNCTEPSPSVSIPWLRL
jgi:hypothetical protein